MSQAELGRRTHIHKATINQYMQGMYDPNPDRLYDLAEVLGCSPEWLLGRVDDKDGDVPEPHTDGIRMKLPVLGGKLDKYGNLLYNDVADYMLCEQEYRDSAHFYIRMKDDSMSPLINRDDLLLCRMSRQLGEGDIGLFVIDRSEVWIRRYSERGEAVVLESVNGYWPPRSFSPEEKGRIITEAKVISCTHKFE